MLGNNEANLGRGSATLLSVSVSRPGHQSPVMLPAFSHMVAPAFCLRPQLPFASKPSRRALVTTHQMLQHQRRQAIRGNNVTNGSRFTALVFAIRKELANRQRKLNQAGKFGHNLIVDQFLSVFNYFIIILKFDLGMSRFLVDTMNHESGSKETQTQKSHSHMKVKCQIQIISSQNQTLAM